MNKNDLRTLIRENIHDIITEQSRLLCVENFSDIEKGLEKKLSAESEELQSELKAFELYKSFLNEKIKILKSKYSPIEEQLKTAGFEIAEINVIAKTGFRGDRTDLKSGDQLRIEGYLKMTGRRKPIKDRDRQKELANNINKNIKDKTGIRFQLNPYSLDKNNRVMFSLWV